MNLGKQINIHFKKVLLFAFVLSNILISSCKNEIDQELIIEHKVDSLLMLMTVQEKIGQMTQVRHFDDISDEDIATKFIGSVIHTQGPLPGEGAEGWQARFRTLQEIALSTRLGIPLIFGVDAVHGQNTFEGATIFPHNIGMGATRNETLVQEAASITAIEMKATGFNWTFSPCLAIPYNEKWGRVYEAFSESTNLTSQFARASVIGYQGDQPNSLNVLATAKHYIGDGSTDFGTEGGNTSLSMQEVNDRLLPPYKEAIDAGVGAIMVSFNSLSDKTMHAHKELISDTLKTAMGFNGIVATDWKGYTRFGKNDIINAGVDMVMAVEGDLDHFHNGLKNGLDSGSVSLERVDDAVKRILRQKFKLGLFENPYPDPTNIHLIGCQDHRNIARQAVRESLVLLKNKGNTLPLIPNTGKIVVVGEHANNSGLQSGGWTINWQGIHESYAGSTTILEGIRNYTKDSVIYDKHAKGNHHDADVVIIVVGENPYAESVGDIGDGNGWYKLTLRENHQNYIKAYAGKGPAIVVVLISGRPLVVTKEINMVDAFVAAWLPGSEGDGVAEVLFGDYDFKGRLPHSWPKSVEDFNGKYGPNFWDGSITPLYEFGFGLNYGINDNK